MIDVERLKRLEEQIKQDNFKCGVTGNCVDVYEKGSSFYETPRLIISTFIPLRYMKEYRKCFDDNYIIMQRGNTNINVSDFLG